METLTFGKANIPTDVYLSLIHICHAGVGLSADEQLSGALFEASNGYFQSDCFGNL